MFSNNSEVYDTRNLSNSSINLSGELCIWKHYKSQGRTTGIPLWLNSIIFQGSAVPNTHRFNSPLLNEQPHTNQGKVGVSEAGGETEKDKNRLREDVGAYFPQVQAHAAWCREILPLLFLLAAQWLSWWRGRLQSTACPKALWTDNSSKLCYKTRLPGITHHVLQSTLMVSPGL